MRYLTPRLEQDLQKKMVLLAGPRQCGKTTLARSLLDKHGHYQIDFRGHAQPSGTLGHQGRAVGRVVGGLATEAGG